MSLTSNIMIIMRGLPGSGKSTIAKILESGLVNVSFNPSIKSTDSKFIENGNYQFNKTKVTEYHNQNQSEADMVCKEGRPVIIDNTNITPDEFNKYVKIGVANKYQVHVITVHSTVEEAYRRTQNEDRTPGKVIPEETIRRMAERMIIGDEYLKEADNYVEADKNLDGSLPDYIGDKTNK